ncbi:hypothetical protein DTO212C5_7298 [Paecilomyces variotii]|nr:hypothetical protein DTO212C5_7298 [Paecilomyces variotii]
MYWKALRLGADANDSKRLSTFNQSAQSRHSEHIPRPNLSTSELPPRRSESTPRIPQESEDNEVRPVTPQNGQDAVDGEKVPLSPSAAQAQTPRRNRFSLMRFRHASDPQLSSSYTRAGEDVPPVPPMPPPTIITTAPTNHTIEQPTKRKNKIKLLPRSKKASLEDLTLKASEGNLDRNARPANSGRGSTDSQIGNSGLGASSTNGEEPGRLSITSLRSGGGRGHTTDSNRSSTIQDPRFSESSQSEASSGEPKIYRSSSRNDDQNTSAASKLFRLPRMKKSRGPLFPLPMKMNPTDTPQQRPGNGSDNGKPTSKKKDSADIVQKGVGSIPPPEDQITPLPSPSHSTVGLSSPRSGAPPLLRNDSTTSARSAQSASSLKGQNGRPRRGRSSTLGSVVDEQRQPPTNLPSSGRNSTSTSGRKSFGDLFNLSQRLRQNSEPPLPNNSSPATPMSYSKPGSFCFTRDVVNCPEREEGDTPATYLSRLEEAVRRGAIAGILSQSGDDFYKTALRRYMRSFAFFGDPIDMALRKLLMEVELPKETQQIDRVLQGFADRYHECNPGIFASTDQAYFIAFSILILHTDVFNKNNKRKMQKHDYVKNTRGEGVADEILECFYDNIAYTPFIHVEDELNLNGRHLNKPRRGLLKTASTDHLSRVSSQPVDPYALILEGKLDTLRPTLKDVMNLEDTYSCTGSSGPPNMDSLHQAFSKSAILQIVSARSRPDAFMTPSSIGNPADSHPGLVDIKVAKVGLLWRKDPKKKKTRSPWQEWGALLTFSQLYFFKDVNWAKSLISQYDAQKAEGRRGPVVFTPPLADFKPDGIMSTDDALALLDSSYKKHKHAFLLIRHNALEETFLANSEADMNDWVAKLNYAAALRTTGVRMKGMTGTSYEGQRRRVSRMGSVASATSVQSAEAAAAPESTASAHLAEEVSAARKQLMAQRIQEANERLFTCQRQLDDLLRNARHLQVLTPVHNRARENVILAAGRMAAKLKWMRLDIWRTKCYREFLILDMGEEKDYFGAWGKLEFTSVANATAATESQPSAAKSPTVAPDSPKTDTHGIVSPSSPERPPTPDNLSLVPSRDLRRASIGTSVVSAERAPINRQSSLPGAKDRVSLQDSMTGKLKRESSVQSGGSRTDASVDGEERVLREAGLLPVDSASGIPDPQTLASDAGADKRDGSIGTASGEHRGRTHRSLHRTLRDSHHGSQHQRVKKGHESSSSVPVPDDSHSQAESEGLSRKEPSFTVHGKKASVITFGSEWQNMSPEERLKLRKPPAADESRASDIPLADGTESMFAGSMNGGRPNSLRSASTTTARSFRAHEESSKDIPSLPPLGELEKRTSTAFDDGMKTKDTAASMEAISPLSSAPESNERNTPLKIESNALSGEETPLDHNMSQEKLSPGPHHQAVSA